MSPRLASSVPATSITRTSNRSMRYPTSGAPSAASSRDSENGSEVAARQGLNSVRNGREGRENPEYNNTQLTADRKQAIATNYQQQNAGRGLCESEPLPIT